ncbi:GH32 C-terminal domain-containing protein [Streptomyces cellulosae]|uniref:GH32 C-terminal domain-containing protein n=1 Tax=Streptomyces cellulosae TaxID=1968 RepID=UPI0004CAD08B|nr:GH32 C-terminal domain-containing protein [Streptomyces cellulosae]
MRPCRGRKKASRSDGGDLGVVQASGRPATVEGRGGGAVERARAGRAADCSVGGATDFDPTFPSTEHAPLALDGKSLRLHVLVDASSVEVYAENARGEQVVLTDQIFPDPAGAGVDVFAENGTAELARLRAWRLASIWK